MPRRPLYYAAPLSRPKRGRTRVVLVSRRRLAAAVLIILLVGAGFFSRRVVSPALETSALIRDKVVVIDPGHGGPDPGANRGNVLEKDITLAIGLRLGELLNDAGATVIYTRTTDTDLADQGDARLRTRKARDLSQRVKIANDAGADIYLSIHVNGSSGSSWAGAQVFFNPNPNQDSRRLAWAVQSAMSRVAENTRRMPLPLYDQYILKYLEMPAVTIEVGFISNPREAALLQDRDYQEKLAWAIYLGVLDFIREGDEPVPGPR